MLHIILAILKILGILLAVLLLLLLLAVFSVLFVPLRYHLTAQKDTAGVRVKGKLTWLLRLIAVSGGYQNAKPYLEFRILFLKKKLLPAETEDSEKLLKTKPDKPKRQKKMELADSGRQDSKKTALAVRESLPETDGKKPPEQERQTICSEKTGDTYNTKRQTEQKQPDDSKISGQKSWFERILEKLSDLWRNVFRTAQKVLEILKNIPQKIREFWEKLKKMLQKTEDFIRLLRSELTKTVFLHFRQHLKYLWKHLQPDKIQGELRYGFSDPAVTGQLTGVLYLLLPGNCYKVRLEPDFENVIYEGQIYIRGHIRFWHLVRVAWKVFRDKEFRTLYRKFASGSLSA
ncbi:DUF2953 domain-containing protein [Lachnospiraceae bacterium 46-15]